MFAFPSFNTEKDVIAYKSFMLADRMEAQWSQNSQNVLLLMVFTNFTLLQFHELFSQISSFAANLLYLYLVQLIQTTSAIRISNFYNEIFVYLLFEVFLQGKVFLIF